MYGTVAHMRVKAGQLAAFEALMREYENLKIPGQVETLIYRLDSDPNELMLIAVFESQAAYVANANSPEQHDRYLKMVELLDGEPHWHDGEVFYRRIGY